ncbi:MAG: MoxR family ATPase, partial [Candidatus Thiodiazotropha endolucinida]
ITGITIFDQKAQGFRFLPGPVFTNILLTDEINRTSPRTQSALLEAMAERTVTVDRKTRKLPATFMVIATQNPIEFSGTFPLPEAQLDRFFMRVSLGYPKLQDETRIMQMNRGEDPLDRIEAKIDDETLQKLQHAVTKVQIDQKIVDYIAALIHATRTHKKIRLGVSPRGSISLMKAAQASALLNDESFVTPLRVQELVAPVLAHRMLLRSNNDNDRDLLQEIIDATPVPAMPESKSDNPTTETVLELAE